MDNEAKKAFLRRYQDAVKTEKSIEDEIRELRANAMMHSQNMDGMPRGSTQSDLSDYAAKFDEMLSELRDEIDRKWKIRREIIKVIEKLPNESEKAVLRLRYINGKKWEQIALDLNYGYQHVHKIHGRALAHLEIPKEAIECDT